MATTTTTGATFTFISSAPSSTFTCSLDGAAFTGCASLASYAGLATGGHTFQVAAIDASGSADPTPATLTWTIEAPAPAPAPPPPDTTITSAPPATTTATDATFSFVATVAGASFKCALDGAAFTGCSSPAAYSGLAVGSHTFRVEAVDETGHADPTPAEYAWTVAALPPAAVGGTKAVLNVRIRGKAIVGHRLSAVVRSNGERLRYRWLTCSRVRCAFIRGATHSSLLVRSPWVGKRLRVVVTAPPSSAKAGATTAPVRRLR